MDQYIEIIKEDIVDFYDNLTGYYRRTKHRLQKLYDFLRLGWNDFDWDHGFLTNILLYKLRKMSEEHEKNGHAENSTEIAKLLRTARLSLYNWQKRDVRDRFIKEYMGLVPVVRMSHISPIYFTYYYPGTDSKLLPEDEKMYSEAISYAHKKERKYRHKYKRKFFKIMYENYERFWD